MNAQLVNYYVEGMLNGWFTKKSSTGEGFPEKIEHVMRNLESELGRFRGADRCKNPEWGEAKKLIETPLMKALG